MAKLSAIDKIRIQTLHKQDYGARAIYRAYPEKSRKLSTVSNICKRVDERGSAIKRKVGSDRPKSARTDANINAVRELLCSQEDKPGTGMSTRQVALKLRTSRKSVQYIAKKDLSFKFFKRVAAKVISNVTMAKRLERYRSLLIRLTATKCRRVFFTDEKAFYLDPPVCSQNNRV